VIGRQWTPDSAAEPILMEHAMPAVFLKPLLAAALILAGLAASATPSEARHRRLGMHGWCRADAAQMMGVSRRAVRLEPHAARLASGRYVLRGAASHGLLGHRHFICHFNARGVLQGAV
jgi:hypothetical protein